MTNVKPATDEQVADILGDLHQYHDYKMAECPFCAPIRARIAADREEIAANAHLISEGIKVVNEQAAEIASLKASGGQITDSERQMHAADRRMNDALRSEIAALKAEVERLKASVRLACSDDTERAARLERLTPAFLPCHVCGGKGISDIIHGAVVRCENCAGTGRAR